MIQITGQIRREQNPPIERKLDPISDTQAFSIIENIESSNSAMYLAEVGEMEFATQKRNVFKRKSGADPVVIKCIRAYVSLNRAESLLLQTNRFQF